MNIRGWQSGSSVLYCTWSGLLDRKISEELYLLYDTLLIKIAKGLSVQREHKHKNKAKKLKKYKKGKNTNMTKK